MEAVPTKTTIREVARAAGVGIGTISRVLNSSSQVSRKTRARVLDAIHRLGFRPNAQARRILKRRAEMVCFLLSNRDFLHPFHARILQGVESYASGMKQHVLFAALHYSPKTSPERIDLPPVLQEHGLIDGVILAGTIYPNLLQRIGSIHMPFVAFSNNVVGMDDQQQSSPNCFRGRHLPSLATAAIRRLPASNARQQTKTCFGNRPQRSRFR